MDVLFCFFSSDNSLTKSPNEPTVEEKWIWRDLIPVIKFNVADVSRSLENGVMLDVIDFGYNCTLN